MGIQHQIDTDEVSKPGYQIHIDNEAWEADRKVWMKYTRVTPAMATEWLIKCPTPGQRGIDKPLVAIYASAMLKHEFRLTALWWIHVDTATFLNDGQHRLQSVVDSGEPEWMVEIHVTAPTIQHVKWDYNGRDGGKVRSLKDRFSTAQMPGWSSVTLKQLARAAGALKYIYTGFEERTVANDIYRPFMRDLDMPLQAVAVWADHIGSYFGLLPKRATVTKKGMLRQSVIGVGLALIRDAPVQAAEFLGQVAADDGIVADTPQHELKRLLTTEQPKGDGGAAYTARRMAGFWNAWIEKTDPKGVRVTESAMKRPIRMVLTRYDGEELITDNFKV